MTIAVLEHARPDAACHPGDGTGARRRSPGSCSRSRQERAPLARLRRRSRRSRCSSAANATRRSRRGDARTSPQMTFRGARLGGGRGRSRGDRRPSPAGRARRVRHQRGVGQRAQACSKGANPRPRAARARSRRVSAGSELLTRPAAAERLRPPNTRPNSGGTARRRSTKRSIANTSRTNAAGDVHERGRVDELEREHADDERGVGAFGPERDERGHGEERQRDREAQLELLRAPASGMDVPPPPARYAIGSAPIASVHWLTDEARNSASPWAGRRFATRTATMTNSGASVASRDHRLDQEVRVDPERRSRCEQRVGERVRDRDDDGGRHDHERRNGRPSILRPAARRRPAATPTTAGSSPSVPWTRRA